jgi:hypothetical protein
MPFKLALPATLEQIWKVKILDKETLYEEPHVTILRKMQKWRWSLRRKIFLDINPPVKDVDAGVLTAIEANLDELRRHWNVLFPKNPV